MRTNNPEDFKNPEPASVDYEQLLHDRAESEAWQAEQRGYDVDEYWKRDKKLYEWSGGIGSVNWHIYAMGFKAERREIANRLRGFISGSHSLSQTSEFFEGALTKLINELNA